MLERCRRRLATMLCLAVSLAPLAAPAPAVHALTLSPASTTFDAAGGPGEFWVDSPEPLPAFTADAWIALDPTSPPARVDFSVQPYAGLFARVGRIAVGDAEFVVTQHGNSATDGWTWRNPDPRVNTLFDVTFGDGQFVAVGCVGSILTSPDGAHWTNRTAGNYGYFLTAVTRGPGEFLAVGASADDHSVVVLASPDGVRWTRRPFPPTTAPTELVDVAWAGGVYVAYAGRSMGLMFGENQGLFTSPDGFVWTQTYQWPAPATFGYDYNSSVIAWNAGTFVVVSGADVLTSADGFAWTPQPGHAGLNAVVRAGDRFVAAGQDPSSGAPLIETSADGVSWAPSPTTGLTGAVESLTWGDGRFVATGGGVSYASADGAFWTPFQRVDMAGANSHAYGGGRFVACGPMFVGFYDPQAAEAPRWTPTTTGFQGSVAEIALGTGAGGGPLYVGVGGSDSWLSYSAHGAIVVSPDAASWDEVWTQPLPALSGVAYGNGVFAAAGAGVLATSADGFAWTVQPEVAANHVEFLDGAFWAVGPGGTVQTSPDGATWTVRAAGGASLRGIARGNGRFVAVGDGVLVSDDGVTWTDPMPATGSLQGVVFGNGVFLAWDSTPPYVWRGGGVWRSLDGAAWEWVDWSGAGYSPANGIAFGQGVFAAPVAQQMPFQMLTSADGLAWTAQRFQTPCPGLSIPRVAFAGDSFFVLGGMGSVIQSGPGEPPVPIVRWLSVTIEGQGSVQGSLGCWGPGTCSGTFPPGVSLMLTPSASPGWAFDGWSGACAGWGMCVVTTHTDVAVVARFVPAAPPNQPPTVGPFPPLAVFHGESLSFVVPAWDPDAGDALTLEALGLPDGASFDAASGTFTWTPALSQVGTHDVTFRATDRAGASASATAVIEVGNRAPVLDAVGDRQVVPGETLRIALSAADPDGDPLRFEAPLLPSGAAFDAPAGAFAWTPGCADAGAHQARFSVTDEFLDDAETIAIVVVADADADGVAGCADRCPAEDAKGFDADADGCLDTVTGLLQVLGTLPEGAVAPEVASGLSAKVEGALASQDKENLEAAVNQMDAFLNQIAAQGGKKVSPEAAALLEAYARAVIERLRALL